MTGSRVANIALVVAAVVLIVPAVLLLSLSRIAGL